jgi:hypothetical protein
MTAKPDKDPRTGPVPVLDERAGVPAAAIP